MTILYRYVTREILKSFFIVLAAVLSIYLAIDFIEKIDNFMEAGIPAIRCVVYLLYKLPFIFVQIAPVGFLLSILIALGLMSKNHEVIALKSCGIGKMRLVQPTFTLGVLFCGLMFLVAEFVMPHLMDKANRIWLHEVRKKNIYATKMNDIWMRSAKQIIHISRYAPQQKRVTGITLFTFDEAFRLVQRIDARSGRFANQHWRLDNVMQQDFQDGDDVQRVTMHKQWVANIELNPDDLAQAAKRSDEMGLAELGRYIDKVEQEGYSATRYRVDYQCKIATPFVCIFLSVLGAALALRGKLREGLPVSITYGLGVAFLYWIFNGFCISLGYAEMVPPLVAAWAANLIFLCVSGFLILNAH
ncbi:LPS export ABC transporter permease LptG [Desulfosarcina ovata subsp. sediminis]|uniref:LPS export ABC transporter permease LptG n=1 Tax=Desulfosarcina ovata subsp. sediminis TaxID=885957 RepID=A0A5K7ZP54_9BACT|nr:LPS export ABC transporter permease LptG [Desulfosarcina ovata]BBO80590.1 LPS export ABC transporter permease LptG [Desulfosarcina ovata subsp. sediminis]